MVYAARRRAVSVDLIPEVEDVCLDDLAAYCSEKTGKGEEMQCLQDNLSKLRAECKVKTKNSRHTILCWSDRANFLPEHFK